MAEYITKTDGDALSKLVQLQAGRHDIRLAWTGHGVTDLTAVMSAHAAKARLAKHLWTGVRELMQMQELKELPEAVQAQMMSIVLHAQALTDLDTEVHAKRMAILNQNDNRPKGAI